MAKRTSKAVTPVTSGDKINIPGVIVSDIIELESEIFPDIRIQLAKILFPLVVVAQIRLALMESKPAVIQGLISVNSYFRNCLAKSDPIVYVAAAVAIRKTSAVYANDPDTTRMKEDFADLITNLSGPIITRGGLASHVNNPGSLRSYRRGIMAQVVGNMQATPIHSPRRIARDVERISAADFLSRLPFDTSDIRVEDISDWVNSSICPAGQSTLEVVESPACKPELVPLEAVININRVAPNLPDTSRLPADVSTLPAWKRAAIQQARKLGGGA